MTDHSSGGRADAPLAVCTIISKNYLAQARALGESLRATNPDVPFFVLLTDRVDGYFDPKAEPFTVIEIEGLPIPDLARFCFQYSILELNTAAKPYLLAYLLKTYGLRKLAYLDPDILVFDSLRPLADLLDRHLVVLTPHLTDPVDDMLKPNELDILQAGTYNLGFIALANREPVTRLLTWWQNRLYTLCRIDFAAGMFVDQKWIDLVPGYFDDVALLRDPGYNVAYWNLHARTVVRESGRYRVNGSPLVFFHFSGYNPAQPHRLSKHQDRFAMTDLGDAQSLFVHYGERLAANGHSTVGKWPYAFGTFDNGEPIANEARRAYLRLGDAARRFGNPFAASPASGFYRWLKAVHGNHVPPLPGHRRMPVLLKKVVKRVLAGVRQRVELETALAEDLRPTPVPAEPSSSPRFGINLAGYFQSEKGVAEGARAVVRALDAAGIPYVLNNVVDTGSANLDERFRFTDANPYAVNVLHVNADQTAALLGARGPDYFKNRYNVGFWNWELAEFPPQWSGAFRFLDEVWTPSTFTQRSVADASPVPVHCFPYALAPAEEIGPDVGRERFGLPAEAFIFLFAFDFHSFMARKNPLAVLEAFRRAFGDDDRVHLVLKSVHAKDVPAAHARIRSACAGRRNVRILDEVLSRAEMHALTQLCDAFVSLHRAEGFGLLLAEAMALGKPVIATNYTSNVDFMNPANSLPVNYQLIEIEANHGPYRKGAFWADPDLDHAVELMRRVASEPGLARELGERARHDITRQLHPQRVGALLKDRLTAILAEWTPGQARADAALSGTGMARLDDLADVLSVPVASRRLLGSRIAALGRKVALRFLGPQLTRQTHHNTAVNEILAGLHDRLEIQRQELADLRRLLLREQARREGKRPAA